MVIAYKKKLSYRRETRMATSQGEMAVSNAETILLDDLSNLQHVLCVAQFHLVHVI